MRYHKWTEEEKQAVVEHINTFRLPYLMDNLKYLAEKLGRSVGSVRGQIRRELHRMNGDAHR